MALEFEQELAFLQTSFEVVQGYVNAFVPDDDVARPVVTFRNLAFEIRVVERMILNYDLRCVSGNSRKS